jgi:hypothetical protein
MKSPFEYRSYVIRAEDGRYTAKSLDGEPCILHSRYLLRALRAVDTLWTASEEISSIQNFPDWIKSYLTNPTVAVDLDKAADAMGEEISRECHQDNDDPISILRFPKAPLRVMGSAAAAAAAAASVCLIQMATKATPIISLAVA